MTIANVAALLARFFGVYLFLDAIIVLTELPTQIINMAASRGSYGGYISFERDFFLVMTLARLALYVIGGICFIALSRPLGKLFAKGLEGYL
jgi:hypothetical protein